jgi:hypothetical protein
MMTEETKPPEDTYAEQVRKRDQEERDARRRARGQSPDAPQVTHTEPAEPATDEPDGAPA